MTQHSLSRTAWLPHALAALTLCLLPACGSSSPPPAPPGVSLQWAFTGLESLGPGHEYEGWVIADGVPVSTGRFTVDAGGVPSSTGTTISAEVAAAATAFVLSIEPVPDADPGPAATKILGGAFTQGVADLTVAHPAALGTDFTAAAGAFILATPSSSVMTDESQGIWWFDPGMGMASLDLPALPAGWAYEGWVVGGGGPVSTGRFTDPAAADSDLAGPAGGPDGNGPPFPGQDFVNPALDLVGLTAVISVEPDPDDRPEPFTLKPLVASPIAADLAPVLQPMGNNAAATNPTGTATIN